MRIFLLLGLLLLIDWYLFQGIRLLVQHWSPSGRAVFSGFYWGLTTLVALYLIGSNLRWWGDPASTLNTYSLAFLFILYISKFFTLPFLLVDDLRRIIQWLAGKSGSGEAFLPDRNRFLSFMGLAFGALPLFTLTYGMIRNPYRYRIRRETVKVPNLPEGLKGLRIVQISDIHSGSFTFKEPVEQAIQMINDLQADLVFFTGDLVNEHAGEMEGFTEVFGKIRAKRGVFSVLGNHDYGDYHQWEKEADKNQNLERLFAIHKEMGWDLLLNEHRILEVEGDQLAVIGVENYSTHPRFPKYGDLSKAATGAEKASVKLLLSHDPSHWMGQVVPDFKDIAITFSGHTHGMQFGVEIPGFLKWSPIQYVYEQWAGLYQEGNQFLYVNRGLGFIGYPGRVGILPEITCLELA